MLLYIHIPFCDSKCHYCAFNSYTSLHHLQDDFVKALCCQLKHELEQIQHENIETVFIGGGTPSCLSIIHFEQIFYILQPYLKHIKEITCEANPNSATKSWLKGIYDLGINRISFGVQSFNDEKLIFLNRNHTSKMATTAIQTAFDIGFQHINCDIIYDTILDNKKLLNKDLSIINQLPIDHISAYSLTIENKTKFFNQTNVRVENIKLAHYIFDILKKYDFIQYEISNFAKNKEAYSCHNIGYWEYKQYLGCGAGAIGCINNKRLYTHTNIATYIKNPISYKNIETLSNNDIKIEKILLGLRSKVGINRSLLNKKELQNAIELVKLDKMLLKNDRFYSTNFMLADELALHII
ncbi:Hypothetical radical SAM family enzyme in heat shock gene cluster, similarity with CPO of BS HemN-type [hydrothermal vent metagenome]|uniref:Hypothetical radical SAM family enzyme in heat shock gene cluster, similarity with CPO of BS HemN-type n=1 Tax=hydrothermal vent metagenome TaxID=652676 RepID=A0A3B1DRG1_9ZZZZ